VYTTNQEIAVPLILRCSQRYCLFLPIPNLEPFAPEIGKITVFGTTGRSSLYFLGKNAFYLPSAQKGKYYQNRKICVFQHIFLTGMRHFWLGC